MSKVWLKAGLKSIENIMNYNINDKESLEKFICKNWNKVNIYLDGIQKDLIIPFYSSIDIRESKTKFAPVDHNMYPAGFNNICTIDLEAAIRSMGNAIQQVQSDAKVIGILPEYHTKNSFYLENLFFLKRLVEDSGHEVYLFAPNEELFAGQDKLELLTHSKFPLTLYKAVYKDGQFTSSALPNVKFDIVILNHDQSSAIDIDWRASKIPIVPTPLLGWYQRQKHRHFCYYSKVTNMFCNEFSINPDLLQARFKSVTEVDFGQKEGLDKLANAIDELKSEIGANKKIFVKASKGTYGMGIMVVDSGDEIRNINRKNRNKMDVGKNAIKFTDVLIQESVETAIKYDDMPAEVTIYQIGGKSIGGFMRANSEKGTDDNLNSRGMVFAKFCISEIRQDQEHKAKEAVYSTIARLASIANGYEIKDVL